jgi:hypothetical protein
MSVDPLLQHRIAAIRRVVEHRAQLSVQQQPAQDQDPLIAQRVAAAQVVALHKLNIGAYLPRASAYLSVGLPNVGAYTFAQPLSAQDLLPHRIEAFKKVVAHPFRAGTAAQQDPLLTARVAAAHAVAVHRLSNVAGGAQRPAAVGAYLPLQYSAYLPLQYSAYLPLNVGAYLAVGGVGAYLSKNAATVANPVTQDKRLETARTVAARHGEIRERVALHVAEVRGYQGGGGITDQPQRGPQTGILAAARTPERLEQLRQALSLLSEELNRVAGAQASAGQDDERRDEENEQRDEENEQSGGDSEEER